MSRAYVRALQAKGVPYNPDFNGAGQRGVGFMQHTIDWTTRRRCNAVTAFLSQVADDPQADHRDRRVGDAHPLREAGARSGSSTSRKARPDRRMPTAR